MKHLIIVDVQNDFVNGSLSVKDSKKIIPIINKLTTSKFFDTIVATQDYHPENHISFNTWPKHCIMGSIGSMLHQDLDQSYINFILRKGMDKNVDSYSAFFDNEGRSTGLINFYLSKSEIQEFYIVGIATDYCVKATAIDISNIYRRVYVIRDACAAVSKIDEREAIDLMMDSHIQITNSKYIL
ncbi:MAG TPA: isochorismatase family protein [Candidatus Paceibacterota bacterium]|nr:isochorismatase family protein [Candidatus Paceibacterota bacterium]